ncbi:hypothetical protein [Nocardiopsis tropica]|uniref:Uncharacterized protein n=1 Tax=Nocardiopsis tropica TaxID=109330 RepID=A0ABV2A055_9ACTN|nr:hypothetical protein [Nocardiopsis tropica]
MSRRAAATRWVALLALLTATGCAQVQDALEWFVSPAPTVSGLGSYDEVDRDDPFGGTPAEDYAEGFEPPPAEPVGSFSAAQVEEAYGLTQDLLDAVYLNPDAVFDEDNSEFTGLLGEQALKWYMNHLGHENGDLDSRHVVFNLAPGTAEPIGDVVKVDGRMWAEESSEGGPDHLAVNTEYTIVHPVARPGDPVSVRLVTTHYGEVSFFDTGDGALEAWPNWWRGTGPAHCVDGYNVVPAYPDELAEGEQPRGPVEDAYDLEAHRDGDDGCAAIRGT